MRLSTSLNLITGCPTVWKTTSDGEIANSKLSYINNLQGVIPVAAYIVTIKQLSRAFYSTKDVKVTQNVCA